MSKEEFKIIPNFPEYKVSNKGRVYSSYKGGRILKPTIDSRKVAPS